MNGTLTQIKNRSKYFLFTYFIYIVVVALVLLNYARGEAIVLVNKTWTPFQDVFFSGFTYLGGGEFALLVVVILFLIRGWRIGMIALTSFIFTAIITQFLKHFIFSDAMRPFIMFWNEFKSGALHLALPEELMKRGNSFPSGHTTSAFSVFLALTLFSKKPILGLFFSVVAILASYSRVYLGQHFFEDIFLGSIIGTTGTFFVYYMFEQNKWFSRFDKPLIKLKKND